MNKAGGRTLEATFNEAFVHTSSQFRYVSRLSRSPHVNFELVDGHHYLEDLAMKENCFSDVDFSPRACEATGIDDHEQHGEDKHCVAWVFLLRNPLHRTLSAFYTSTGRAREAPSRARKNLAAHHKEHFKCELGSMAEALLQNASFTFTDFVKLPLVERNKCFEYNRDLHVRYLTQPASTTASVKHLGHDEEALERLTKAKERLVQLSWFGIMEDFELSLKLFSYTFGLDLTSYHPVFNQNQYSKNLAEKETIELERFNQLDGELYSFAKTLFYQRVKVMEADESFMNVWGSQSYHCSERIKCWDKLDDINTVQESMSMLSTKALERSEQKQKQRILCGPVGGCMLQSATGNKSVSLGTHEAFPRCLPTFLIIGSRKGGTTSLYSYLSHVPRVLGVRLDQGAQSGELFFFRGNKKLRRQSSSSVRKQYNKLFITALQE